jgi:hypothetical protein
MKSWNQRLLAVDPGAPPDKIAAMGFRDRKIVTTRPSNPAIVDLFRPYQQDALDALVYRWDALDAMRYATSVTLADRGLNFTEAFDDAVRECPDPRYLDMSFVLDEADFWEADLVDPWIWGPELEFTGYARVKAFEKFARYAQMPTLSKAVTPHTAHLAGLSEIKFRLTPLERVDTYSIDVRQLAIGVMPCRILIQFATYSDQAGWARLVQGATSKEERRRR